MLCLGLYAKINRAYHHHHLSLPQIPWCELDVWFSSIWIWISSKIDTQSMHWSFENECHIVQHAISKFLDRQIVSCCCFPHRQCPTESSLLHRRPNLKQIKCMHKTNNLKWRQFTCCTLCICINIYEFEIYLYITYNVTWYTALPINTDTPSNFFIKS